MFLTKLIPILLLFLSNVRSSDNSNDAYKQIHNAIRAVREVYKYNHSPEEAIPVAIVFDNDATREEKSIDDKVSILNKHTSSIENTKENNSPTLIKLSKDFSVKSTTIDRVKVQPGVKIITEEDLQIPVAVVYEQETTTVRNRKKVLRRNKVRNQGQSNRRRVQKVEPEILENKATTERTAEQIIDITTTTENVNEQKVAQQTVNQRGAKTPQRSRKRPVVPIIQSENKVFGNNGDFHYSYEGGDGTKAFETGELKSFDNDKTGESVVGGFSYTDKDGQDFSLSYTADENGYRPVGAHLPTPPPIPPAIERALRYLATKTTPEPVTDSVADSKDDS